MGIQGRQQAPDIGPGLLALWVLVVSRLTAWVGYKVILEQKWDTESNGRIDSIYVCMSGA